MTNYNFLDFSKSITMFEELVEKHKERQEQTKILSQLLGIDISLSDEETLQNAQEDLIKNMNNKISKGVNEWMKSIFS